MIQKGQTTSIIFSVLQSVLKMNIHEVNNEILKNVLHIPIFALSANK